MNEPELLAHELAHEQAHVDAVYARLEEATQSARSAAASGQEIFRSNRETWVREEDGTALFERDAFTFQAAKRLAVLDAEHEGLVFGRLDLEEPEEREVRYIGRIGVRDEDYEPLVIDWRARAAEPFYRATPQQPMDVVRRRVLRCRNDRVVGIEDDLLDAESNHDDLPIIGEGALMASLSRARGTRMKDIVATIQAEQDLAIRAEYPGVTIISGGPGTGKTVVALHRAAFLLYSNRRRFEYSRKAARCRATTVLPVPGPPLMIVTPGYSARIARSCSAWIVATMSFIRVPRARDSDAMRAPSPMMGRSSWFDSASSRSSSMPTTRSLRQRRTRRRTTSIGCCGVAR